MELRKAIVLGLAVALALAGCAGSGNRPSRAASTANYCPAGTILVCRGLFEPEKERRPDRCACAELVGHRTLGR